MGTAQVIRERRTLKGRAGIPTGARSGRPRKRRSARSLCHFGERRRRRRRLAVFLALLFAFGVGYSIVGLTEERIASSVGSDAPAAGLPKDKTRKVASSATTCDDLGVLVDRSHSIPQTTRPKTSSRCGNTAFPPWVVRCSGARPQSTWHASWKAPQQTERSWWWPRPTVRTRNSNTPTRG